MLIFFGKYLLRLINNPCTPIIALYNIAIVVPLMDFSRRKWGHRRTRDRANKSQERVRPFSYLAFNFSSLSRCGPSFFRRRRARFLYSAYGVISIIVNSHPVLISHVDFNRSLHAEKSCESALYDIPEWFGEKIMNDVARNHNSQTRVWTHRTQ